MHWDLPRAEMVLPYWSVFSNICLSTRTLGLLIFPSPSVCSWEEGWAGIGPGMSQTCTSTLQTQSAFKPAWERLPCQAASPKPATGSWVMLAGKRSCTVLEFYISESSFIIHDLWSNIHLMQDWNDPCNIFAYLISFRSSFQTLQSTYKMSCLMAYTYKYCSDFKTLQPVTCPHNYFLRKWNDISNWCCCVLLN